MADKAHVITDNEIAKIQRHIASIYNDAQKDITADLNEYADTIKDESDKLLAAIDEAENEKDRKTAIIAYRLFYLSKVKSKQFKQTTQKATERLYKANTKAAQYINSKTAHVYAINYNQIGNGLQSDLDGYEFKPVTDEEVEKYGQITRQNVNRKKDTAWNKKNIVNAVIAGAFALYGVKKIFDDAAKSATRKNKDGGNRQASDTMTDAENSGRLDSMYRASDEGFNVKKYWVATLDNRTRETHREYDSMQPVELDYEYAPGLKKPRDPNCAISEEVCNCRCRILYNTGHKRSATRAAREGNVHGRYREPSSFTGTETVSVPNMTYEEWVKWRSR